LLVFVLHLLINKGNFTGCCAKR